MLYTPYIWPCIMAGALLAGIGVYAFRFRDVPAARPFRVVMWGGTASTLVYALSISTNVLSYRVWLGNVTMAFVIGTVAATWVMVVEYVGLREWLTRLRKGALAVVAAALALLALTSPYTTLFRTNFRIDLTDQLAGLQFSPGPLYAAFVAYMLVAPLASIGLLIWAASRGRQPWRDALLIALGILLPAASAGLFALGLSPLRQFDASPVMLVPTGLLLIAALARGQFLEVTHIARDLVMDTVEDLVIVLDSREHVVDLNPAARQMLGYAGRPFAGVALAALPAPWAGLLGRDPGRAVGQHEIAVDTPAERRIYDLTLTPIRDARSRPVGRLCLLHDVTARTQAEADLRESEEKFRRMAETTASAMFIHDGHRLLFVNPAFHQMTGYSDPELAGMDSLDVIHPEHRELARQRALARLRGEPAPARYEVRVATRGGQELWVDMSVATVIYRGQPAILGTWLDVTARRRLEEDLRASQNLFQRVIEDQTDPVCRWLPDATITFVNQAYCDYFGRSREALLGTRFTSFLPAKTQAVVREAVDTLLRHEAESLSREEENLSPSGEKRWMVWAYQPVANADGAIVEFQSVGRDITDRKRAEQALQRANEDLAAQLATVQSLQAQLFEQAVRDMLTGLFNRRYMEETLEREIAAATRAGHSIGLIMLDLDLFKKLNDTFGHKAGDLVLHWVGQVLREHTRQMDVACRFGGEEFVVIMPATSVEVASQRAEQLRQAVEALSIEHLHRTLRTTISAGVAAFPGHGTDGDSVVRAADMALYAAKAAGRNCVKVYQGPPAAAEAEISRLGEEARPGR